LNLSKSSIEKRKMQIKDYLCIAKGTDEDIVRESRKLGFI
jgi:two-component system, NarL family, response regulator NreC